MAYFVVDHKDGGKCLLNGNTGTYQILPKLTHAFNSKGKLYPYSKDFGIFKASEDRTGIILVFCTAIKHKGKRLKVTFLSDVTSLEFFNVERIDGTWACNDIENCIVNKAYLIYVEKNSNAINDMLIRKAIQVKNPVE